MLSNALEARALRDSLRNEAIRKAVHDIDSWRETQRTALIDSLVSDIISEDIDTQSLARTLGTLDPRIEEWVNTLRPKLKATIIKMVAAEPIMDHLVPQAQEILDNAWDEKRRSMASDLESRTNQFAAELDQQLEARKHALTAEADQRLLHFQGELEARTADEIQQRKNAAKLHLQQTKDDFDSRELSLAIRTPKAAKPSPLTITKSRKKKKKVTILDLTTPSPGLETTQTGNETTGNITDMETDTDSTPTTPICRSSAPSPAPLPPIHPPSPFPSAPEEVPLSQADPESIPKWTRTPSPDDRTPHAPTFTAPEPLVGPLAALMAAITGLQSQMLTEIGKVNARIDQSIAPQTISDYIALDESNLAAFEQPTYILPPHDETMADLEEANADRLATKLRNETHFRTLLIRLVAEKRILPLEHNDHYVDEWNRVCTEVCSALHIDPTAIPEVSVDSILNAWRRVETALNEEEFIIAANFAYERITGVKPNTSSAEGKARFSAFTTVYNDFCATHGFPAHEGFPESQDAFFKHMLAASPGKGLVTNPPKTVRFTSAPPIATLPAPSPDDFPVLRAPSQEPVSYASAAAGFTTVTRRRRGKATTAPAAPPKPTSTPSKPTPATGGPKSLRTSKPPKPPLPDALKTTKYTIILDHTNPNSKSFYTLDVAALTRGLQTHLETVKAPLVLLAGTWSSAPFYKIFFLTFSGIINFTDITKYNSILFGPFGSNCCAAPTAGYQSILISGVRLQCDAQGKLASPKMLHDKLCRNPVFVGRLPLATPRWLFNPNKLLESDKQSSSITFLFHNPTGEGLELMKRSRVRMFGKLVTIRSWEARPLLSQCTRCLRLGHTVDKCHRHKDLVVCSKCGGAHQDALYHFNCPHANKHKGRGCDCPPSCFLCIAQGNPKAAQGHTSTSVLCPIRKHFRTPTPATIPADRGRSTTIPPTPAADGPMTVLTSANIRQFSNDGMAVDDITRLLVPPKIAALASTSTTSAT